MSMILMTVILTHLFFRESMANYTDIKTIRAIVKGPLQEIANWDKDLLLYNVKYLQKLDISRDRKKAVYKRIRGDRRLDEISMTEFEQMGTFMQGVTCTDLNTKLDYKRLDIVSLLGKSNLKRKLLGCLAQLLKKELGKQVFMNYKFINKFGGVICGYGVEDLVQIDEDNFILIDEEVFVNLDQCNLHQMRTLYNTAVKPTVYGIPQGWSKSVVRTLGSLLTLTPLLDLMGMDPMSFMDVKPKVLKELSSEKLDVLKPHLRFYVLRSQKEIWKKLGLPSSSLRTHISIKCLLIIFSVYIMSMNNILFDIVYI